MSLSDFLCALEGYREANGGEEQVEPMTREEALAAFAEARQRGLIQ
jgi:hypothetical protein